MAITTAAIDAAINEIMTTGQSVSVDGVQYSKASLQSLIQLRDRILAGNAKASRPTIRAMNFSGMGYS